MPSFSHERLLEQLRTVGARIRRWLLPSQQSRERSDALLWRLRLAERVFGVVLVGLGAYLVVDLAFHQLRPPVLHRSAIGRGEADGATAGVLSTEAPRKEAAEYRQTLVARNPFGLAAQRVAEAIQETAKSRLAELASSLVVVGINRGRIPEALVEDTVVQRTYVVKIGDQINGLTVQSIDQRGVVVSYEEEETLLP